MINIQNNISLKNYNTFHIDAEAKFFVIIKNIEELLELIGDNAWEQNKLLILGGGANILFTKNIDGLVLKNEIAGIEEIKEDGDDVYIKAGSGVNWNELVNRCVNNNYGGIENLSLIPGTVGSSAVGNIGAYGVETKDIIYKVEYLELDSGEIKTLSNLDCKFGYRDSIFKNELKNKVIITGVVFKLKKGENYKLNLDYKDIQKVITENNIDPNSLGIKDISKIIIKIRESKLPDHMMVGTAGSFFKNPIIKEEEFDKLKEKYTELVGHKTSESGDLIKLSAGQLIELSGLKGYRVGDVGVSKEHALILVNYDNATGEEIVNLANHIISEVKKNFGVVLTPEVIYI